MNIEGLCNLILLIAYIIYYVQKIIEEKTCPFYSGSHLYYIIKY